MAYVRQTYCKTGLPGGNFDINMTFAQAITEAARATSGTLLVASIPSSDIEIGGEGGKEALTRLKNTFGRMESPWRPASAEESFEIVRRRLFESISDPKDFSARDAVIKAFGQLYRGSKSEFPQGCAEGDYERRLEKAYPIHPELFDRLYEGWGSLERFQRTRGVLRLMASVISELWDRQDALVVRAVKRLKNDENLITQFSPTRLRLELDRYPWKDVDHLNLKKLWEYFATYLYLPRLRDSEVLIQAVQEGVQQITWAEHFAYAEGYAEDKKRYRGIKAGQLTLSFLMSNFLVKL